MQCAREEDFLVIYKASHILLEDEEDALEMLIYLEQGQKFEELAQEYSICDSAKNGGTLGKFSSGSMVPEFEKALFKLLPGEVSKPIKTKYGFHIIKKLDI